MAIIRRAIDDDIESIAGILRSSFRHTYPNFPELHTTEEDIEFIGTRVFPDDEVYVAEDGTAVVGFIAFNQEFIDHLYLLPESQRKGIGTSLIECALAFSTHLKLWTFQQNTGAIAFYQKHGFVPILETDGSGSEEQQPDVLLERKV